MKAFQHGSSGPSTENMAGDGSFFEHIGLPPDSTWEQFCKHYADRGGPSSERVGKDLATYPPIAR